MKAGLLGFAAMAGLALLLQAAAADIPDAKGAADAHAEPLHYEILRAKMVASGFKPLVLKHDANDYFCIGDDLCRTYPEVLSCVMAGAPACRMAFFDPAKRNYVLVITNSDHLPLMVTGMIDATSYDVADIRAKQ
jgi:hypothetical protein